MKLHTQRFSQKLSASLTPILRPDWTRSFVIWPIQKPLTWRTDIKQAAIFQSSVSFDSPNENRKAQTKLNKSPTTSNIRSTRGFLRLFKNYLKCVHVSLTRPPTKQLYLSFISVFYLSRSGTTKTRMCREVGTFPLERNTRFLFSACKRRQVIQLPGFIFILTVKLDIVRIHVINWWSYEFNQNSAKCGWVYINNV